MARFRALFRDFKLLASDNLHWLVWIGFAFLFLGLFVKITWELHEDSGVNSLDGKILILISKLRLAGLNGAAVDLTALGSPTLISLFTVVGILVLLLNRDRWGFAYLAIGSLGAGLATFGMKNIFNRPRPSIVPRLVEVSGFSYPSGHSLGATSFYLLLMFLTWRHFGSLKSRVVLSCCAIFIISGVCFSRLYLGVHYPSDVLSGICLGAAWVFFLTAYFSRTKSTLGKFHR